MDLSLAALTGDGVFNFGEVLATPLLAVLQQTPHAWLSELLQVRKEGRNEGRAWVFKNMRTSPPPRSTHFNTNHLSSSIVRQVFDHGDVDAFAALVERHRDAYFAQPALANRQEFVKVR